MAHVTRKRTPASAWPPLIIVALACAASMVIGSTATLVIARDPVAETSSVRDTGGIAIVQRFYDAVGETLRTGDTTTLAEFVAPDLVEHPTRIGFSAGRDGLVEALLGLRSVYPQMTIVVEDIRGVDGLIAATTSVVTVVSGSVLGLPVDPSLPIWNSPELFRIEDGLIAEHWAAPQAALAVQSLATERVDILKEQAFHVGLSRRAYAAQAFRNDEVATGPIVIVGQAGRLQVTLDGPTTTSATFTHASRSGRLGEQEVIGAGGMVTLAPNDTIYLQNETHFTSGSDGQAPAEVLVLALTPEPRFGEAHISPPPDDSGTITDENLAWGLFTAAPSAMSVQIGRLTLGPGAAIPPHDPAGPELVAMESGSLELIMTREPALISRGPAEGATSETVAQLEPGNGAVAPADAGVSYRNASAGVVVMLMVTINYLSLSP